MPQKIKPDHREWRPGVMAAGVAAMAPHGVTQHWAMFIISQVLAKGSEVVPAWENIEVTISITDDAIHHMMRKR